MTHRTSVLLLILMCAACNDNYIAYDCREVTSTVAASIVRCIAAANPDAEADNEYAVRTCDEAMRRIHCTPVPACAVTGEYGPHTIYIPKTQCYGSVDQ